MREVKTRMKFHDKILSAFKWGEFITLQELVKRIPSWKSNRKNKDLFYSAWQDLTCNGRLQEGINNTYRINN